MANVRRVSWANPSGKKWVRYEYSLQVAGKQERKLFETREEAEAAMADRQKEIREGRIYGVVAKSFGQVAADYLAYKKAKGKRSVDKDDEILTRRLLPFFGADIKVSDISAQRIAEYERSTASALHPQLKRPVATATVNRHLSILRCLLRLAKKWGYVRDVPHFEMGQEPDGRLRYLEREEAARLLAACKLSQNRYLHAIVTVALHTGMRKGEILGLTWERVDFSRGVLLLDRTKSGKRREVPMSQAVYTVLSDMRRRQEKPEGLVFRRADGSAWGRVDTAFSVALRKAGISEFRFHDLRHTFASWLVMQGRPLLEVKELLGHHEISMTMRYAHLAPGRLREAVTCLDGLFDGDKAVTVASLTQPSQSAIREAVSSSRG